MKKQLTTMMILVAAMTLFSATASAQALHVEVEPYDFNPTLQVVGATAGAGLGGFGGAFAGAAVGSVLCDSHDEFLGCLGEVVIGGGVGIAVGSVSGSVLGAGLTGGSYADADNYAEAAGGAVLGGLVAIPLTFGVVSVADAMGMDSSATFVTGAVLASASMGLGASLGYRATYNAPRFSEVRLTPMVGEHNGLVLSGRF
jgi:hypothetical protein